MDYFFVSGAWDTGKNALIHAIARALIANGYQDITGRFPVKTQDTSVEFICILEGLNGQGKNRKLLINTATDDEDCVEALREFRKEFIDFNIMITSIRDGVDPMRKVLLDELKFDNENDFRIELPLARIVRINEFDDTVIWYQREHLNVALHILRGAPFLI